MRVSVRSVRTSSDVRVTSFEQISSPTLCQLHTCNLRLNEEWREVCK